MSLSKTFFNPILNNISEKFKDIENQDLEIRTEKLTDNVKKLVNDWYNLTPHPEPINFLVVKIYTKIRKNKKYKNHSKKFRVIKYTEHFLYRDCNVVNVDMSNNIKDASLLNVNITFK